MPDFFRLPPQVFSNSVKSSNVLALPALKSVGMGLGKALGAMRGGAGRYLELLRGTKLQNLVRKHELASELGGSVSPYSGNVLDIVRKISGGGLGGQIADNATDVARRLQHQALGEAAKVYGTRVGTTGAGVLAGAGGLNAALANKQSAALPEPTCRGTTKKVELPRPTKQEPYVNPEGVMMNNKSAVSNEFNALMNKLVRSPSNMTIHFDRLGLGGAGAGAIAGALMAPRGKMLNRALRGAAVGGIAGLGAGAGASLGGNLALGPGLQKYVDMLKNPVEFNKRLHRGASIGAGLGGGAAGLIAHKAINKSPESEKKEKADSDKDDSGDEEVRKSAAIVLAQLQKNAAEILPKV